MAKQPEKTIMEELLEKFVVRVMKPEDDDRGALCGELFIGVSNPNHDGTTLEVDGVKKKVSYVDIPAHQADYIKQQYRHYVLSKPFDPSPKAAEVVEEVAGKK